MTTQEDIQFLKGCLKHTSKQEGNYPSGSPFAKKLWWGNEESVSRVALILVENCTLITPESVISFFDEPNLWEDEMEKIVNTQRQKVTS